MRTRIALKAGKKLECRKSFGLVTKRSPANVIFRDRVQQARGAFSELGCHVIAEVDYQFVIYAYCQREESPSDIKSF